MTKADHSTDSRIGTAAVSGWVQRAFERMQAERLTVIAAIRGEFVKQGFDVAHYSDDEISDAVLADSNRKLPRHERLAYAFQRLTSKTIGERRNRQPVDAL